MAWQAPPAPVVAAVPLAPTPRRHPQRGGATFAMIAVLGVLALVAVAAVTWQIGLLAMPIAAVLALVPLIGIIAWVWWIDRWEPEPVPALAVAFLWGASVSVLIALVLNTGSMLIMMAGGTSEAAASVVSAVVVAPIVEETAKGLGLLLVFLVWRKSFDGPVDGLVYGSLIAAGFAFVENILYFGNALAESGAAGLAAVFVLRAIMSPFAHLLFTAAMGIALGYASHARSRSAWWGAFPLGWLVAVGLHALWNGSAMAGTGELFLVLYVLVQVPLFLGVIGLAYGVRRREGTVIREHLTQYARAGWFNPAEVTMLGHLGERGRARAWASGRGGPAARAAMRQFQQVATRLAYARHRVLRGRPAADQHGLLADLGAARVTLLRTLTR